jgi:hypothetical protein
MPYLSRSYYEHWYHTASSLLLEGRKLRSGRADAGFVKRDDIVAVHVWDGTSEVRYLVLTERPPGTEALWDAQLAALVTRDAMVGARLERSHLDTHLMQFDLAKSSGSPAEL